MPRTPRSVTEEEKITWRIEMGELPAPKPHHSPATERKKTRTVKHAPHLPAPHDHHSQKKLHTGTLPSSCRLDLHHATEAEAYGALQAFLASHYARGTACVLIITGKGKTGGGVLKRAVPLWLNTPALRGYVKTLDYAKPAEGGQGALRIRLQPRTKDR